MNFRILFIQTIRANLSSIINVYARLETTKSSFRKKQTFFGMIFLKYSKANQKPPLTLTRYKGGLVYIKASICLSLFLAKSESEYDRILSFTMLGIKNPFDVSLTHLFMMVLLLTASFLLISIGVNS